ncbi:hypothetical protein KSP39_PZI000630 [Platanthera zijinensis]|uniref:Uncharacterized protein n=1 Tax=Platanthera zijinensis TaxID=2320716 RepID=A0AAP0GGJ3_9ASPA
MAMSASPEPRQILPSADFRSLSCASPPPPPPSRPAIGAEGEAAKDAGDQFRTPTTEESRLNSTPTTCPPPPVKARRLLGCKRKLSELEFFKIEAEEMERLFRPRDLMCVRMRIAGRGDACLEDQREAASSLSSV